MERITLHYAFNPGYVVGTVLITSVVPLAVFSILGIGMVIFGFANTDPAGNLDLASILLGLFLLALMWIGTPLVLLWKTRRMLGQPIEVAFDDNGIRQDAQGMHFQGDWSTLRTISRRGPYLLLKLQTGAAVGLPISAFDSPEQANAFLAMTRSRLLAKHAIGTGKI